MSQERVELVQQVFVAWDATGEPPWEIIHEDVEVHDHDIMDAGEYRGRAGVERWLADWDGAWSEFAMDPQEFIDCGERVVAVLHMTATGRGSGAVVDREDAMLYEIRDGLIVRLDYYNNREQALAAAGASE